jgi:hypothetical protein
MITTGILRALPVIRTQVGTKISNWVLRMDRVPTITTDGSSKDMRARVRKIAPGVRKAMLVVTSGKGLGVAFIQGFVLQQKRSRVDGCEQ